MIIVFRTNLDIKRQGESVGRKN